MKINHSLILGAIILTSNSFAGTSTTTTTSSDGSTTVVETTDAAPASSSDVSEPKLVGPTGVTGTIRRSDRRQDRRLEEDLEDLGDAVDRRRPSIDSNSVNREARRR